MKKFFKTVALATAIAVGAATMTGCDTVIGPNPDPTPTDNPTNPTNPQTQVITLAMTTNDMSKDLRPYQQGARGVFKRTAYYNMEQFEEGKTYHVEGSDGDDNLIVLNTKNLSRSFNIVSKGVAVSITNAGPNTSVHIEMATQNVYGVEVPVDPFFGSATTAELAVGLSGPQANTATITGTRGLWVANNSPARRLP